MQLHRPKNDNKMKSDYSAKIVSECIVTKSWRKFW